MNGSSHTAHFQLRHALSVAAIVALGFFASHTALHAGTLTVTTTNDSGAGSLRQAILDANASNDLDTIQFSIPDAGVQTIAPSSPLPAITNSVIIDGYTQTNSSPNTLTNGNDAVLLIELDGSNAGTNANGLVISAGNSTVRGLVIDKFLTPCCVGYGYGIILTSKGGNVIEGNFIGIDPSGTIATGNGDTGVSINGASSSNLIGGATTAARNVISGNHVFGIDICCSSQSSANQILGNFIGTDLNGTNALGNYTGGLRIAYSSNNIVGGTSVLARNIISGNYGGLTLAQNEAVGNVVQGNFIGVAVDGVSPLGNNGAGVNFFNAANGNTIGGTNNGEGNVIAFNSGAGISVGGGVPGNGFDVNNSFLGNSIYSNGGLGIDLIEGGGFGTGVTDNDDCDGDNGPNRLQNFPVLTLAGHTVSGTAVEGSLNSTSSTNFRIEFFSNPVCDSSGSGEGRTFLGFTNVTTDANCEANFVVTFAGNVSTGEFITATAADPNGNTSEFSQCIQVEEIVERDLTVLLNLADGSCTTNSSSLDCPSDGTVAFQDKGVTYLGGTLSIIDSSKLAPKVGCKFFGTLTLTTADLQTLPDHQLGFYLSDDNTLDAGDTRLLQLDAVKLAKAFTKNKPVKLKFKLPKGTCPTGKFLIVVADDVGKKTGDDAVFETDETNNTGVHGSLP